MMLRLRLLRAIITLDLQRIALLITREEAKRAKEIRRQAESF